MVNLVLGEIYQFSKICRLIQDSARYNRQIFHAQRFLENLVSEQFHRGFPDGMFGTTIQLELLVTCLARRRSVVRVSGKNERESFPVTLPVTLEISFANLFIRLVKADYGGC
jgi:hypothetical protein